MEAAGGIGAEGLLECLAKIPDPRDRRGVRYALASILALCLAAMLSGEKLREDIVAFAAAAPRWLLAAVGVKARHGRLRAPHAGTVERVLNLVDGQAAGEVIGVWFARRAGLGVAGATDQDPPAPAGHHLDHHVGDGGMAVGGGMAADVRPVLLVDGQPMGVAVDGKAMAGAVQADGRRSKCQESPRDDATGGRGWSSGSSSTCGAPARRPVQ